ncbi:MAG: ISAs1 family transposase [Cyanobacteria bacterium P01_D01_bin.36]
MPSIPKKTCQQIVDSGNHYLGALKGNHGNFFKALKLQFQSTAHVHSVETAHGRVERRTVSLYRDIESLPNADQWAGLKTIVKVTSYRHILKGQYLLIRPPAIRYYISSLEESVESFARRIRDYWQVENKVHYVRDVTQGEDASRIRVQPLPNIFALARNLALNLYRDHGFDNMAQAQRKAGHGLDLIKSLFRMK